MIQGYNIAVQLNAKTVLARTTEELNISAITKESITKDDNGVKKTMVTGHDVTLSISALAELNAEGETTKLDRDDIIAMALATGSAANIPLKYLAQGGDTYQGTAIITGYSESSSADADADSTISLNLAINGEFTKVTA